MSAQPFTLAALLTLAAPLCAEPALAQSDAAQQPAIAMTAIQCGQSDRVVRAFEIWIARSVTRMSREDSFADWQRS